MIEGWIRILIALFLLLTGAQESSMETPAQPTFHSLTQIDSVEALVLESFPAQINLVVSGTQPDGCDFPVQVTQTREGNTVTVEIFREVPMGVMCPAVLRFYNETIHLDGSFESGTYTIRVNDYELDVTI